MAAIVNRLSMVKGWPMRSAAKARRATGATPITQAATKAHLPISGATSSTAQAAPSNSAVKITKSQPAKRVYGAEADKQEGAKHD